MSAPKRRGEWRIRGFIVFMHRVPHDYFFCDAANRDYLKQIEQLALLKLSQIRLAFPGVPAKIEKVKGNLRREKK